METDQHFNHKQMRAICYILLALLLSAAAITKAQNRAADTTGAVLSQKLGVSPERAQIIAAALNYHRAEIRAVAANRNLPAAERQKITARLMAERWQRIKSSVTPEEMKKIREYIATIYVQETEKLRQQNKMKATNH